MKKKTWTTKSDSLIVARYKCRVRFLYIVAHADILFSNKLYVFFQSQDFIGDKLKVRPKGLW